MANFKDLFSKQSGDYAKYRPTYPRALFEYLSSLVKDHGTAWDCGAGNGQSAVELANIFETVIATDPSEKQLANAIKIPNVIYKNATAEESGLSNGAVSLITVAQAIHWFRHEDFFREAARVLKPDGILAFWCYELAKINPAIDKLVLDFYQGTLHGYWEKERRYIEEGYRTIEVPTYLKELQPRRFQMTADWTLEELVGYLSTWSALQTYIQKNAVNPLEPLYEELKKVWKQPKYTLSWELGLRVFRKC